MTEIRVTDWLKENASEQDCTQAVFEALRSCKGVDHPVLIFEPGTYHFYADEAYEQYYSISNNDSGLKRIAFPIVGIEGLTVEGNGSHFIFHGRVMPFMIDHSQKITIRNVMIDYKRPFYTQGEVLDAGEDYADLKIDGLEYPYRVENGKLVFYSETWESDEIRNVLEFDAKTRAPKWGCKDHYGKSTSAQLLEGHQ